MSSKYQSTKRIPQLHFLVDFGLLFPYWDHSGYRLSQWEKALLCNAFSRLPSPYPELSWHRAITPYSKFVYSPCSLSGSSLPSSDRTTGWAGGSGGSWRHTGRRWHSRRQRSPTHGLLGTHPVSWLSTCKHKVLQLRIGLHDGAWQCTAWKRFPHSMPCVRNIPWSLEDFPHKGSVIRNFNVPFGVSQQAVEQT